MSEMSPQKWYHSAQWRRVFLICAAGVLLVAVLMASYTFYKPVRAQQLSAEALTALEKGDLAIARQKVMAANELAGRSVPVARAMARVWGALAPGSVVPLWERAVELSHGDKADKQGLALALLAAGELERSKALLAELMESAGDDPQTTFLQINWLIATLRTSEALSKLEQLTARYPRNESYLKVYSYLVRSQGPQALAAYKKHLNTLKTEPTQLGIWALEEQARLSSAQELEPILKELFAHPQASRDTLLFAYQMRRVKAGMPYEKIRKEVAGLFNVARSEERRELARFYRTIGDNSGILDIISPRMAALSREDLMLYIDALAGSGKWQPLLEILNIEKLPLEDYWREIFRARAYAALKRTSESQIAWRKALVLAGNNSQKLSDIAQYLIAMGAAKEIDEVMPRLIENSGPMERAVHYQTWLQIVIAAKDTARAQFILEKMSTEFPKNMAVRNDYIYYSSLLKKPGDWSAKAYELAKDAPAVVAHRMTLSLALYRSGQIQRAYEVINSTRVSNWSTMPPGWQLLRAAILKAVGQPVPEVTNAQLALPEERALIQ